MRFLKITLLLLAVISLTSCASAYKSIQPKTINYLSSNVEKNIQLEYKYDLLDKKYAKKEVKKGIKVVALKVTNNSNQDVMFGRDVKLAYANGNEVFVMENERVFKSLKQSPATYLLYLLLTPMNLHTSSTNSQGIIIEESTTPIGLVIGPGLTLGNMMIASSANKTFKSDLTVYNLNGTVIKAGETKYGVVGLKTETFEALKLIVQ